MNAEELMPTAIDQMEWEAQTIEAMKETRNVKNNFILKRRHKVYMFLGRIVAGLCVTGMVLGLGWVITDRIEFHSKHYISYFRCYNCEQRSALTLPNGKLMVGTKVTCSYCKVESRATKPEGWTRIENEPD